MDDHTSCSLCRHQNSLENRFCGSCDTALTGSEQLVPRREDRPTPKDRVMRKFFRRFR